MTIDEITPTSAFESGLVLNHNLGIVNDIGKEDHGLADSARGMLAGVRGDWTQSEAFYRRQQTCEYTHVTFRPFLTSKVTFTFTVK